MVLNLGIPYFVNHDNWIPYIYQLMEHKACIYSLTKKAKLLKVG